MTHTAFPGSWLLLQSRQNPGKGGFQLWPSLVESFTVCRGKNENVKRQRKQKSQSLEINLPPSGKHGGEDSQEELRSEPPGDQKQPAGFTGVAVLAWHGPWCHTEGMTMDSCNTPSHPE